MSKKDSYIYKISKEIHKGTEIASNSLEKLTDHCVEHKINRRNDKGCDLRSQLYNTWAPLSTSFFLLCSSFHFTLVLAYFLQPLHDYLQKRAKRYRQIHPGELQLALANFLLCAEGTHLPRCRIFEFVLPFLFVANGLVCLNGRNGVFSFFWVN